MQKEFSKHIFINQTGYLPDSRKYAIINQPVKNFEVFSENGTRKYSGVVSHFGKDELSGDDVYIADFSKFCESGKYYLTVDGKEKSMHFEIGSNVYQEISDALLKAYYYLRCGIELLPEFAGEFCHGKCHVQDAVLWENPDISMEVTGGWHDAGDYGRYVTAGACALGHLLYAYQLFPDSFQRKINIPESKDKIPDILAECRIELNWLLKMQRRDGAVYHKLTTKKHAPFIMPEEDLEQLYVFPVSSMATADFCGVCALAAEIYQEFDCSFSDRLQLAARKAYAFLEQHPEWIGFENPEGNDTGDYSEETDADNRFWASAQMYALTGEERYHSDMMKHWNQAEKEQSIRTTKLGWISVGGFGTLAYIFCKHENVNIALQRQWREDFITQADHFLSLSEKNGYGAAMETWDYSWGSNMIMLVKSMIMVIAELLTKSEKADSDSGKSKYREAIEAQWHYLLGVNALGYSYVTGIGGFCVNHPHYRPSIADGIEKSVPGLVSGGPNQHPDDVDAKKLISGQMAPMKCFVDSEESFSLNEVTIYWNSPAVFLSGYIQSVTGEE